MSDEMISVTRSEDWPKQPWEYPRIATCGACGRSWDDSIVTSMTPAPSARCPFEAFEDDELIPEDWPVQPVERSC